MPERYDLLMVGEGTPFILADAAARAFLRNLMTTQLAVPAAEAVAKTWAEVYLQPGVAAHTIFAKGSAPAETPFLELALHFGEAREPLPFGDDGVASQGAYFWLEIRGAAWPDVLPTFRRRFEAELATRPRLLSRPHVGLPAHREVPEAERRPGAAPRTARGGQVGTRIEEF